jgi:hypothetical protein
MAAMIVLLNGQVLAQVATEGLDVLSVHVHGVRTDSEFATMDMHGGSYPEGQESTYLTWVNSVLLKPGDVVDVALCESGQTLHPGKTFQELFPDEPEEAALGDFNVTPEAFADLKAKPQLRDGYHFSLALPSGTDCEGTTNDAEHGFGFSVVWNSHRTDRASVSLHSYRIDDLEHRQPMRDHAREYIVPTCSLRFQLIA